VSDPTRDRDRRYVFLYSSLNTGRLKEEGRSGLEDDLDEFLEGAGETTGGGSGSAGWNVDVELEDHADLNVWVDRVVLFLRKWQVPEDTVLDVNGQRRVSVFGTKPPVD